MRRRALGSARGLTRGGRPLLFGIAAALCVTGRAHAAPASSSVHQVSTKLVYTRGAGTESCPDALYIENAVAARLGYDPFHPDAQASVHVSIERRGKRLVGEIELFDASGKLTGSRKLSSAGGDCGELASSMSLAVSIAVDPLSFAHPHPPSPKPKPTPPQPKPAAKAPPAPAPPQPLPAPVPHRAPPPRPRLVPELGAGLDASLGLTPHVAPGAWVYGGVRWKHTSLGLEAHATLPTTEDAAQGRVRASALLATLLPCLHQGHVFGCALGSFGVVLGRGGGVDVPHSAATAYAALGARVGIELALSARWSAVVHGDGNVALTPTKLLLNDQPVWSSPAVWGAVGLGVLARFP